MSDKKPSSPFAQAVQKGRDDAEAYRKAQSAKTPSEKKAAGVDGGDSLKFFTAPDGSIRPISPSSGGKDLFKNPGEKFYRDPNDGTPYKIDRAAPSGLRNAWNDVPVKSKDGKLVQTIPWVGTRELGDDPKAVEAAAAKEQKAQEKAAKDAQKASKTAADDAVKNEEAELKRQQKIGREGVGAAKKLVADVDEQYVSLTAEARRKASINRGDVSYDKGEVKRLDKQLETITDPEQRASLEARKAEIEATLPAKEKRQHELDLETDRAGIRQEEWRQKGKPAAEMVIDAESSRVNLMTNTGRRGSLVGQKKSAPDSGTPGVPAGYVVNPNPKPGEPALMKAPAPLKPGEGFRAQPDGGSNMLLPKGFSVLPDQALPGVNLPKLAKGMRLLPNGSPVLDGLAEFDAINRNMEARTGMVRMGDIQPVSRMGVFPVRQDHSKPHVQPWETEEAVIAQKTAREVGKLDFHLPAGFAKTAASMDAGAGKSAEEVTFDGVPVGRVERNEFGLPVLTMARGGRSPSLSSGNPYDGVPEYADVSDDIERRIKSLNLDPSLRAEMMQQAAERRWPAEQIKGFVDGWRDSNDSERAEIIRSLQPDLAKEVDGWLTGASQTMPRLDIRGLYKSGQISAQEARLMERTFYNETPVTTDYAAQWRDHLLGDSPEAKAIRAEQTAGGNVRRYASAIDGAASKFIKDTYERDSKRADFDPKAFSQWAATVSKDTKGYYTRIVDTLDSAAQSGVGSSLGAIYGLGIRAPGTIIAGAIEAAGGPSLDNAQGSSGAFSWNELDLIAGQTGESAKGMWNFMRDRATTDAAALWSGKEGGKLKVSVGELMEKAGAETLTEGDKNRLAGEIIGTALKLTGQDPEAAAFYDIRNPDSPAGQALNAYMATRDPVYQDQLAKALTETPRSRFLEQAAGAYANAWGTISDEENFGRLQSGWRGAQVAPMQEQAVEAISGGVEAIASKALMAGVKGAKATAEAGKAMTWANRAALQAERVGDWFQNVGLKPGAEMRNTAIQGLKTTGVAFVTEGMEGIPTSMTTGGTVGDVIDGFIQEGLGAVGMGPVMATFGTGANAVATAMAARKDTQNINRFVEGWNRNNPDDTLTADDWRQARSYLQPDTPDLYQRASTAMETIVAGKAATNELAKGEATPERVAQLQQIVAQGQAAVTELATVAQEQNQRTREAKEAMQEVNGIADPTLRAFADAAIKVARGVTLTPDEQASLERAVGGVPPGEVPQPMPAMDAKGKVIKEIPVPQMAGVPLARREADGRYVITDAGLDALRVAMPRTAGLMLPADERSQMQVPGSSSLVPGSEQGTQNQAPGTAPTTSPQPGVPNAVAPNVAGPSQPGNAGAKDAGSASSVAPGGGNVTTGQQMPEEETGRQGDKETGAVRTFTVPVTIPLPKGGTRTLNIPVQAATAEEAKALALDKPLVRAQTRNSGPAIAGEPVAQSGAPSGGPAANREDQGAGQQMSDPPANEAAPGYSELPPEEQVKEQVKPWLRAFREIAIMYGHKITDIGIASPFVSRFAKKVGGEFVLENGHKVYEKLNWGTSLYDKLNPGSSMGQWMDGLEGANPAMYEFLKSTGSSPGLHRVWFGHDPLANVGAVIEKYGVQGLPEFAVQLLKDSLTKSGIPNSGTQWLVHKGTLTPTQATEWASWNIGDALSGGLAILGSYKLHRRALNGQHIHAGWAWFGISVKVVAGVLRFSPVLLLSALVDTIIVVKATRGSMKAGMQKLREMEKAHERDAKTTTQEHGQRADGSESVQRPGSGGAAAQPALGAADTGAATAAETEARRPDSGGRDPGAGAVGGAAGAAPAEPTGTGTGAGDTGRKALTPDPWQQQAGAVIAAAVANKEPAGKIAGMKRALATLKRFVDAKRDAFDAITFEPQTTGGGLEAIGSKFNTQTDKYERAVLNIDIGRWAEFHHAAAPALIEQLVDHEVLHSVQLRTFTGRQMLDYFNQLPEKLQNETHQAYYAAGIEAGEIPETPDWADVPEAARIILGFESQRMFFEDRIYNRKITEAAQASPSLKASLIKLFNELIANLKAAIKANPKLKAMMDQHLAMAIDALQRLGVEVPGHLSPKTETGRALKNTGQRIEALRSHVRGQPVTVPMWYGITESGLVLSSEMADPLEARKQIQREAQSLGTHYAWDAGLMGNRLTQFPIEGVSGASHRMQLRMDPGILDLMREQDGVEEQQWWRAAADDRVYLDQGDDGPRYEDDVEVVADEAPPAKAEQPTRDRAVVQYDEAIGPEPGKETRGQSSPKTEAAKVALSDELTAAIAAEFADLLGDEPGPSTPETPPAPPPETPNQAKIRKAKKKARQQQGIDPADELAEEIEKERIAEEARQQQESDAADARMNQQRGLSAGWNANYRTGREFTEPADLRYGAPDPMALGSPEPVRVLSNIARAAARTPEKIDLVENVPTDWKAKHRYIQALVAQFNAKHDDAHPLINLDSGHRIRLSVGGMDHFKNFTGDARKWALLPKIEDILQNAVLIRSEQSDSRKQPDRNIRAWHKLALPAFIGGEPVVLRLTVREDGNGNWLYDASLHDLDIERPANAGLDSSSSESSELPALRRAAEKLLQKDFNVNPDSEQALQAPEPIRRAETEGKQGTAATETVGRRKLPPHKQEGFIRLAGKLTAEGIDTPKKLAAALDTVFPNGDARPYSQALWTAIGVVNQDAIEAAGKVDWSAIYGSPATAREEAQTDVAAMTDAELAAKMAEYEALTKPGKEKMAMLHEQARKAKKAFGTTPFEKEAGIISRKAQEIYKGYEAFQTEINRRSSLAMKERNEATKRENEAALARLATSDDGEFYPLEDGNRMAFEWWNGVGGSKEPTQWQRKLMDAAGDALDAGVFYDVPFKKTVTDAFRDQLPPGADVEAKRQDGHDFGYQIYLARQAVERERARQLQAKVAALLQPGLVLKNVTLGEHRFTSLTVDSVNENEVKATGKKRGTSGTYNVTAKPSALAPYIKDLPDLRNPSDIARQQQAEESSRAVDKFMAGESAPETGNPAVGDQAESGVESGAATSGSPTDAEASPSESAAVSHIVTQSAGKASWLKKVTSTAAPELNPAEREYWRLAFDLEGGYFDHFEQAWKAYEQQVKAGTDVAAMQRRMMQWAGPESNDLNEDVAGLMAAIQPPTTVPETPSWADILTVANDLTIQEFAGLALKGRIHRSTGAVAEQNFGTLKSPLSLGFTAGYSLEDIAHFYISRRSLRGVTDEINKQPDPATNEQITQAFDEFAADAAKEQMETAAHEAATSPQNDLPEPTEAQKKAGNFKKGHLRLHGLDISIENPRGSTRSGKDRDGKAWSVTLPHHYGYLKRTTGKDGENVDVFIGPNPASESVFIVDQVKQGDGHFDEVKVLLGFDVLEEARDGYEASFTAGWKVGPMFETSLPDLKAWLAGGDMQRKASEQFDHPAAEQRIPTLLEFAKSKLPAFMAAKIKTEEQAESFRAQYEKEKAAGSLGVAMEEAPAKPDTPAQAEAKVEEELQTVAAEEGTRPAAEVKKELIARLEAAIKNFETGQSLTDETITIRIPGDGTFTLRNNAGLADMLKRVKRLPVKITEAPEVPYKSSPPVKDYALEWGTKASMDTALDQLRDFVEPNIEALQQQPNETIPATLLQQYQGTGYYHQPNRKANADYKPALAAAVKAYQSTQPGSKTTPTWAQMHTWLTTRARQAAQSAGIEWTPEALPAPAVETPTVKESLTPQTPETPNQANIRKAKEKAVRQKKAKKVPLWDKLQAYFVPGALVSSYVGTDKVLSLSEKGGLGDGWRVEVIRVNKDGSAMANESPRWHSTLPSEKELNAAWEKRQEEKPAPSGIVDFGEKIHGSRKDIWGGFKDRLTEPLPDDVADITLSKHFPEPDYDAAIASGVSVDSLATFKALRDLIPSKPRSSWKLKQWAGVVRGFHEHLQAILSDKGIAPERLAELTSKAAGNVGRRIKFYKELGYPAFTKAAAWDKGYGTRFLYGEGPIGQRKQTGEEKTTWAEYKGRITDMRAVSHSAEADTAVTDLIREKILADMAKQPEANTDSKVEFNIYRDRFKGDFFIGKKAVNGVVRLKTGFKEVKEARQHLADQQKALEEQWEGLKAHPDYRRPINAQRQGPLRREGDVSPEMFGDAFSFRGVQFGNWVEDERRQVDLNEAYDALVDLAEVLGVPAKALSLDGSLGLAFGARGTGGKMPAAAHYEADMVVINLTKKGGPGTLAHEWFHAFDNYFARLDRTGATAPVALDRFATREASPPVNMRPVVWSAFKGIREVVRKGAFSERSKELDDARSKPYYGTTIEKAARAFEKYVQDRLTGKEISNDYLVNIRKEDSPALPTAKEMEEDGIREAYDTLFNALEQVTTEKGVRLQTPEPVGNSGPLDSNNEGGSIAADDSQDSASNTGRDARHSPGLIARDVLGRNRRISRTEPARETLKGGAEQQAAEFRKLIDWAKESGLSFDRARIGKERASRGEHRVYEPTFPNDAGRAFKLTLPGQSGLTRVALKLRDGGIKVMEDDATPAEYLDRWDLHNEMFGDAARFEGIIETEAGPVIVISQPHIAGPLPDEASIAPILVTNGWKPTNDGHWWKKNESGMIIGLADIKDSNWIQDSATGAVLSIDTIPFIATEAMLKKWGVDSSLRLQAPARVAGAHRASITQQGAAMRQSANAPATASGAKLPGTKGTSQDAGSLLRDLFYGRHDVLDAIMPGTKRLIQENRLDVGFFRAATKSLKDQQMQRITQAFGSPKFWNVKRRAKMSRFLSELLPAVSRLNATGYTPTGDLVFSDFDRPVGFISDDEMKTAGVKPGDVIPLPGSSTGQMVDIAQRVPERGGHVLTEPMPANTQAQVYTDFASAYPEGEWVLFEFIAPGMEQVREVGPGGTIVPVMNRSSLLNYINDDWSPALAAMFTAQPLPPITLTEGWTPDIARQRTAVAYLGALLRTMMASIRKGRTGERIESGDLHDLIEGFEIAAFEAAMEKSRLLIRNKLINQTATSAPPPASGLREFLSQWTPMDDVILGTLKAFVLNRKLALNLIPEKGNPLTADQRALATRLLGDGVRFWGTDQAIPRRIYQEFLSAEARDVVTNKLLRAADWFIKRYVAGLMVNLGTFVVNVTSNPVLRQMAGINRLAYAITSAAHGDWAGMKLGALEWAHLMRGLVLDQMPLLQKRILSAIPAEIYDDNTTYAQADGMDPMKGALAELKDFNPGAAFLKFIRYGSIDSGARLGVHFAFLRARASVAADKAKVKGKARRDFIRDWMDNARTQHRQDFEETYQQTLDFMLDVANDVPAVADPSQSVFNTGGQPSQLERVVKRGFFSLFRYKAAMARYGVRNTVGSVKALVDPTLPSEKRAQAAANLLMMTALAGIGWMLTGDGGDDEPDEDVLTGRQKDDFGKLLPQSVRTGDRMNVSKAGRKIAAWLRSHGVPIKEDGTVEPGTTEEDLWVKTSKLPLTSSAVMLGHLINGHPFEALDMNEQIWMDLLPSGPLVRLSGMSYLTNPFDEGKSYSVIAADQLFDVMTAPILPSRLRESIVRIVDPQDRLLKAEPDIGYNPGLKEVFQTNIPWLSLMVPPRATYELTPATRFSASQWRKEKLASIIKSKDLSPTDKEEMAAEVNARFPLLKEAELHQYELLKNFGVEPTFIDPKRTTGNPWPADLQKLQEKGYGADSAVVMPGTETITRKGDSKAYPRLVYPSPDSLTKKTGRSFLLGDLTGLNILPVERGALREELNRRKVTVARTAAEKAKIQEKAKTGSPFSQSIKAARPSK